MSCVYVYIYLSNRMMYGYTYRIMQIGRLNSCIALLIDNIALLFNAQCGLLARLDDYNVLYRRQSNFTHFPFHHLITILHDCSQTNHQ